MANNGKGPGLLGVGSILSGASSLFGVAAGIGAGRRQKELMDYQYQKEEQYQKRMGQYNWDRFNSPAAQRRAMQAAGINPFVGDSSIGTMQMDSNASSPGMQDAANPLGDVASSLQAGASSLFQMGEMKRVNDSIIEKNESDALKARADAGDIGATQPGRVEGLGLDNQRKRTDNAYQEQFLQTELGQKIQSLENSRQELNNLIKSGKLTDAQVETTKKQLEIMDGQIALLREQVKTEGAKRLDLREGANLKHEQAATEFYKRAILGTYDREADLIDAKSGEALKRAEQMDREIDLLVEKKELTKEQANYLRQQVAIAWKQFGVSTGISISREAREWFRFFFKDKDKSDSGLITSASGSDLAKAVADEKLASLILSM